MYEHSGTGPVVLKDHPIDPDSTDWIYISYQNWLRPDESIISHVASIEGGTIVTPSTPLGSMTDTDGISYEHIYAVQITPSAGSKQVKVTHRITTETTGLIDLGRTKMDLTVVIPVRTL